MEVPAAKSEVTADRVPASEKAMSTLTFHEAERKQLSMLAAVEKKTLVRMARLMPAWVNSDHLTVVGFVAMFAAVHYWAASFDSRELSES